MNRAILRVWSATTVGNDRDLQILGQAHNVLRVLSAAKSLSKTRLTMSYKNLGDLIAARVFNYSLGDIPPAKNPGFDLQASREAQVFFY